MGFPAAVLYEISIIGPNGEKRLEKLTKDKFIIREEQ